VEGTWEGEQGANAGPPAGRRVRGLAQTLISEERAAGDLGSLHKKREPKRMRQPLILGCRKKAEESEGSSFSGNVCVQLIRKKKKSGIWQKRDEGGGETGVENRKSHG